MPEHVHRYKCPYCEQYFKGVRQCHEHEQADHLLLTLTQKSKDFLLDQLITVDTEGGDAFSQLNLMKIGRVSEVSVEEFTSEKDTFFVKIVVETHFLVSQFLCQKEIRVEPERITFSQKVITDSFHRLDFLNCSFIRIASEYHVDPLKRFFARLPSRKLIENLFDHFLDTKQFCLQQCEVFKKLHHQGRTRS
jgi:hypothetical protein